MGMLFERFEIRKENALQVLTNFAHLIALAKVHFVLLIEPTNSTKFLSTCDAFSYQV
jgi:hypothetical protein